MEKNENKDSKKADDKSAVASNQRFTSGAALKHEKDDLFHHSDFVDVLEDVIEHSETPLNIALYGRWGVGKSTIVNFLEERISTKQDLKKKYDFVNIDAWRFSPDSVRQELLLELNKKFKAMDPEEIEDKLLNVREEEISSKTNIGKWLRKFLPYLGIFGVIFSAGYILDQQYSEIDLLSASAFVSVIVPLLVAMIHTFGNIEKSLNRTSKRIIPRIESSQQFQHLFNTIIAKKKKPKVIIAIDNLDRCEDEVVVKILGTIKTFMDAENCIYLIPCDENAIIKHLKAREEGRFYEEREAIEFLTKFFQVKLHIPTLLEGTLENYADKQMSAFKQDVEFDASVKDVLISGVTRSPRKMRQFLYNLVVLYKLALIKENKGIIRKGTVTGNTAFLTKMVVLRDEWPDFYRRLENRPDLLELVQRHLDGETVLELGEEHNEIFKKNSDLDYFLKSTNLIRANNIMPFLRLNQESFESVIPELETLTHKVSQNDVPYVRSALEKLEPAKRHDIIREIIKLSDDYIRHRRFQFAFNSMNVLLEVFDEIPDELKDDVISKFSAYMRTKEIRESLYRCDVSKLFPLVLKMEPDSRDELLKEYCRILSAHDDLSEKVLPYFVDNSSEMSIDVIRSFDYNLKMLGQGRPEKLIKLVQIIAANEEAKSRLVKEQTIEELIQRITPDASKENKDRIDLYFKFKNTASPNNKIKFAEKMITTIEQNKTNALEANSQYALDVLGKLEKEDLPKDVSDLLYNRIKKFITQFTDENQKKSVMKSLLLAFPNMSENNRKQFVEQHLSASISSLSPNFLSGICEIAKESNVGILGYDVVLDNIIAKLGQGPMNENVVSFLIEKSPEDKKGKVGSFIVTTIKGNNPTLFQPVAVSFGKNHAAFSNDLCENICRSCLDIGKTGEWSQRTPLFDAVALSLEKCSEEIQNEFADLMMTWLKSGDANQRSQGLTILSKGYTKLSEKKQSFVISQTLLKLETLFTQNDSSVNQLLGFLTTNIENLKDSESEKLIDVLLGVIATGQPQMQNVTLNTLPKIKLGSKSDEVLQSVLGLAKTAKDQGVKNTCKETLKQLKEHATEKIKEDVNNFFGEAILN